MTTWANGDTLTAAWMNSVEQVLALGTYGATTSPRLTITPNQTYDISSVVAADLRWNGSVSTTGSQQYEAISFRTLTSTLAGTSSAAAIAFNHSASPASGCSAYNIIGSVTGTSGAGKINPFYGRVVGTASFTGIGEVLQAFSTSVTGLTWNASSALIGMGHDTTDLSVEWPIGIYYYSNTAGAKIQNCAVISSTLDVTIAVLQYQQRAGSTGSFLVMINSGASALFTVDYLGDIKFETTAHYIKNASTNYLTFQTNGDIALGKASAATGDTTGHIYIQSHAGAPTGVPAGVSGYSALRYDTTAHKLYVYDGGWKATAALT